MVGGATTELIVHGDARVTGIMSVGTGTLVINETGINATGVATFSNFKTGTTNVHNVGVEAAGINVLGADTPIGVGATIYNSGGADFVGVVTATDFKKTDGSSVGPATLTIGVRSGDAISFTATGSSFNVIGRSSNISISI